MAIEEFNNISNNLELVNMEVEKKIREDFVLGNESFDEDSAEEDIDEGVEILKDIDAKIKVMEGWFKSELVV